MKCRWNAEKIPIPIRYRSDTDQIPTKPPSNTSVDTNTHNIPKQLRSNTDHVGSQARPRVAKVHRPILPRKEKRARGVDPVCKFIACRPWHAPQETLAWQKRRENTHTDTIPIKYRSDTDQIPIKCRWNPPIKYVCRYNTNNIPKQLRSNTDHIPIKYMHRQNGTNNDKISTKYRYNTDTIPIEYRYSTYPCLCFLLHVHSISSSRRTPACVRFCQCIVVCLHSWRLDHPGPMPASHAQYMPQIHPRRSIKCSKSLHAHWLSESLRSSLSFSLSLFLSLSLLLSLSLSLSLSLFRPLISLLISLLVTLADSHTFSLASKCWSVFGSACDQARQMGVNLTRASNVWALLAECTYVYSRYGWLYYWG